MGNLIPNFQTANLRLRAYQKANLPNFLPMQADCEVIHYLIQTEPWPRERVEKWLTSCRKGWDEQGYGFWILEHKVDQEPIGGAV